MSAATGFALATALHAGFQVTVTVLVYPALAASRATDWPRVHARHSSAIVPLVGVVYLALLGTGAALVLDGPGPLGWAALGATTVAVGTTAALAAPLHGRLAAFDERRVARLLVVDRWRCAAAVLGAVLGVGSLVAT